MSEFLNITWCEYIKCIGSCILWCLLLEEFKFLLYIYVVIVMHITLIHYTYVSLLVHINETISIWLWLEIYIIILYNYIPPLHNKIYIFYGNVYIRLLLISFILYLYVYTYKIICTTRQISYSSIVFYKTKYIIHVCYNVIYYSTIQLQHTYMFYGNN